MPVFHLPSSNRGIAEMLTSIMLFPNSLARRRQLQHAFDVELAQQLIDQDRTNVRDQAQFDKALRLYVPSKQIIERAGKDIGADGSLAGALLLLTLGSVREVASLNLSKTALDDFYKCNKPTSKRKLAYLWKEFSSVAHFWAIHQIWIDPKNFDHLDILPGFPCHPSQILLFLSYAEYLRRKGEGFKAARARKDDFILDKNVTYKVRPPSRLTKIVDEDFRYIPDYKILKKILEQRSHHTGKAVP